MPALDLAGTVPLRPFLRLSLSLGVDVLLCTSGERHALDERGVRHSEEQNIIGTIAEARGVDSSYLSQVDIDKRVPSAMVPSSADVRRMLSDGTKLTLARVEATIRRHASVAQG